MQSALLIGFRVTKFNSVAAYLWKNAGFDGLRSIKELDDYEPRYDPTVIPGKVDGGASHVFLKVSSELEGQGDVVSTRHHYSIADYNAAYKSGRVSPTTVAETLLNLLSSSSKYDTVFVDVRKKEILATAEESTLRFKEGKSLGILDGVPLAVKDEVDLSGCSKTLGSANKLTAEDGVTSWCVRKWEEAGAVILGKLNMHEFGLGREPLADHSGNTYDNNS